jgi:hypothetical protein
MGWSSTASSVASASEVEMRREAKAAWEEESKGKRTPSALDKAAVAWAAVATGGDLVRGEHVGVVTGVGR